MVLMRALKRDIALFRMAAAGAGVSAKESETRKLIQQKTDNIQGDRGWKALTGDIFRRPKYPLLLAILIGSGEQTVLMVLSAICLSAVGLASPAMHRSLINCSVFLFAIFGVVNGYDSARWYRYFEGEDSFKQHVLKTALFFPAFNFVVFLFIDLVIWADSGSGATNAVPFGTFVVLIVIWAVISVPMVYLGAYYGYKSKEIKVPCVTRQIPRLVPTKPWYLRREMTMVVSGMVVFISGYMEMSIIMRAMWGHRLYFAFGFLLVTWWLMMACSALVSLLVVYIRLTHEDYNWWWISFFAPASAGIVMFVYCAQYFFAHMHVLTTWTSYAVYFGHMFLLSTAVGMMCGFVGFSASFVMLKTIYRAIKSD